jgi:hypothetical protein
LVSIEPKKQLTAVTTREVYIILCLSLDGSDSESLPLSMSVSLEDWLGRDVGATAVSFKSSEVSDRPFGFLAKNEAIEFGPFTWCQQ